MLCKYDRFIVFEWTLALRQFVFGLCMEKTQWCMSLSFLHVSEVLYLYLFWESDGHIPACVLVSVSSIHTSYFGSFVWVPLTSLSSISASHFSTFWLLSVSLFVSGEALSSVCGPSASLLHPSGAAVYSDRPESQPYALHRSQVMPTTQQYTLQIINHFSLYIAYCTTCKGKQNKDCLFCILLHRLYSTWRSELFSE